MAMLCVNGVDSVNTTVGVAAIVGLYTIAYVPFIGNVGNESTAPALVSGLMVASAAPSGRSTVTIALPPVAVMPRSSACPLAPLNVKRAGCPIRVEDIVAVAPSI